MPSLHRSLRNLLPGACAAVFLLPSCTPSKKELGNVYRDAIRTNLKTLDPALTSDRYSNMCVSQVYETLYQYKYLSRPYDVEPALADSLPAIADSGREYTIRLKPGIRFADDSCFPGGKGREVRASDFVYSTLRLADVRTQSTGWWIYEGKIRGLDDFRAATERLPPFPDSLDPDLYRQRVEGIEALDSLTVRIRLTRPYPYFKYILAMNYAAVVAREAVTTYGEDFRHHPVGTGPYLLDEWRRGLRVTFKRNPNFRREAYPTEGMPADSARGLLADAGKPLPFIDRVEINIFEEDQTMMLNFLRGNLDRSSIPKDNYDRIVTPEKTLHGPYAEAGFRLVKDEDLDLTYTIFNMEDPLLGKHKKLRQALSLSEDADHIIKLFYNGRAIRAHSPIPPGLFGFDTAYKNPFARHDIPKAKALLAEAGFPDGQGLPEFEYLFPSSSSGRQMAEHFVQGAAKIGIKVKLVGVTWPEFLGRLKGKKIQIAGAAWGADYPDPENFLQLFYGPNESPGENNANFKHAEYDSLFVKMAVMQDSPERLALIRRMKDILAEECPIIPNTHRLSEYLAYDWVGNLKPSAVLDAPYKYLRVDAEKRSASGDKEGR
jgi:oligopeptide transport system substrate-binding protein